MGPKNALLLHLQSLKLRLPEASVSELKSYHVMSLIGLSKQRVLDAGEILRQQKHSLPVTLVVFTDVSQTKHNQMCMNALIQLVGKPSM